MKEGARLEYIFNHISKIVKGKRIKLAVMEGPAFQATNRSYSMGEAYGIHKLVCSLNRIKLHIVPPCKLKKYFTGKGHGSKSAMIKAATDIGYSGTSDDEADSMACSILARDIHLKTNTPGRRASLEVLDGF
jgi:Holliday junction resolvasome RuvABC endonuclease subunit